MKLYNEISETVGAITEAVGSITETTTEAAENFTPNAGNFIKTLPYLAEGMIGIAIAMGVIIGMIYVLNKIFKKD